MDIFLKRVAPPQSEPQAGPSGAAPGEGAVVTGHDRSFASEDPQWDQMRRWERDTEDPHAGSA